MQKNTTVGDMTTVRNARATTKRPETKTVRFEDTPSTVEHSGYALRRVQKNTTAAVDGKTTKRNTRNTRATKATVTNDNDKILLRNSRLVVSRSIRKNVYKGLIPEKIIGISQKYPQLMFVVKWKNIKNLVLVESSFMNMNHPTMVIKYYESIIQWKNDNNH